MKLNRVVIEEFGCLRGLEVVLKDGLNVIYGENGAGKSTFFSFIKSAFYGFSRGGKQREKRMPWNGNKAAGNICFSDQQGTDWVLQVRFGKTARGDHISIYHALTGEERPVSGWPGQELFSMGEETFLKTACVGQSQLAISPKGQDEIAEKLANLEQTGEDAVSYTSCRKTLDGMLTALRAKRGAGGLLNQAEAAVAELAEKENIAVKKAERAAELYRRLKRVEQQLECCKQELEHWKAYRKAEKRDLCLEYQKKILLLTEQEQGGEEEYEVYENLAREWKQEEDALNRLKQQVSPLPPRQEAICSREEFTQVMEGAKQKRFAWIISAFMAAFLCGGMGWLLAPVWYVGTVLFAGVGLFFALRKKEQPWERFGASSRLEFSQLYAESLRKQEIYEAAVLQRKKLEEQIIYQQQQIEAYQEKGMKLGCETPEDLFSLCAQRRERQAARREASKQKKTFEELLAKILDGASMEEIVQIPDADCPSLSEDELNRRQLHLTQEREQLIQEQNQLFAKGETPDMLRAARMEWEEKRERYRCREEALRLAVEVLDHAYGQMEQQFGGKLNETAGELLCRMTSGKYREARISKDYQVRLTEGSQAHSLEQFSGGLYDQVYLAYRLAMLALMQERAPILLDDVLMQYDDIRAEHTISALVQYAARNNCQVFLFTCRKRDLNLAKQQEGVNCVTIL